MAWDNPYHCAETLCQEGWVCHFANNVVKYCVEWFVLSCSPQGKWLDSELPLDLETTREGRVDF